MVAAQIVLGNGAVGKAVLRRLKGVDARIFCVSRNVNPGVRDGVQYLAADVADVAALAAQLPRESVIYHCINTPYDKWPETLPPLMRSVRDLAQALDASVVYADNLYCYGEPSGAIHERLAHERHTRKGSARAEVAEILQQANNQGRIKAAIVRASDFFGPHVVNATFGTQAFGQILSGKPVSYFGPVDVPHSYTYIDDFADALVEVGIGGDHWGQVLHVPSETYTAQEFVNVAAQSAGTKSQARQMPGWLFKLLGSFIPPIREYREMLYEFEKPFVIDSSTLSALGKRPTSPSVALQKTVEFYRQGKATQEA